MDTTAEGSEDNEIGVMACDRGQLLESCTDDGETSVQRRTSWSLDLGATAVSTKDAVLRLGVFFLLFFGEPGDLTSQMSSFLESNFGGREICGTAVNVT